MPSQHLSSPHDLLSGIVARAQQEYALFPQPSTRWQPVVVAVSGGVDSVTLLHILMQVASEWQLELHIAHVDHALRPDSAADAAVVRELATRLHLPFHTIRLDGAALRADRAGLEAAARTARYRFLCATAINVTPETMVPMIAAAHHADDQAETLLLRLTQGSGLGGLAAMRAVTVIDDAALTLRSVRLVRPLLAASRAQIVAYARHHALAWREDESNADETRSRNLIRHQVLPALTRINPQVVATLARTADQIAGEHDRLRSLDEQTLRQRIVQQDEERIVLRLGALQELTPAMLRGLLHTALAHLDADLRTIGATQIHALCTRIMQARRVSGPHPLAGELAWSVVAAPNSEAHFVLHRRAALPLPPPGPWLDKDMQSVEWVVPVEGELALGAWIMRCRLIERSHLPPTWRRNLDRWMAFFAADQPLDPVLMVARAGCKIDPLGMEGRHRRIGDLFTDHKVPPALRLGWPVLYNRADDRPMWVCGLTQSHATRITETTKQVLQVHFFHTENECKGEPS